MNAELDPGLNRLPEHIQTIHLIGACGTGMGALAGMLVSSGYRVTGSDANVYPPMSDFLRGLGIRVSQGYAPENLSHGPDLVVVGNVVTRQNPEAIALAALRLHYLSFPQALRQFFLNRKRPLVVAGTHGKTTTCSLAAWMLASAGFDPGFMIGGIAQNFGRNFQTGTGEWFVVEGDEYDTAFFDKVPKFTHYAPEAGILTSVEFDHADIYPDFEAVKKAFRGFSALVPAHGLLAAWGDDPLVREIARLSPARTVLYGLKEENDWRAVNLRFEPDKTLFDLVRPDESRHQTVVSPLPGTHNVLNALAVAAVMNWIGLDFDQFQTGLAGFKGVRRRQEVRGIERGVTVIDDFAHHPTAVRETLAAIRGAYKNSRLIAVFEPRTNTSRRKVFQQEYPAAFDEANRIIIREPPDMAKIPETERFSSEKLVQDLLALGKEALYFQDTDDILAYLQKNLEKGDVALIMSNGGFDNIHERLLRQLQNSQPGILAE